MSSSRDLPSSDAQLWQAAAAGDAAARQVLIERAWSGLAARLRRFDADDRDDLRQRIAAAVLRALATNVHPASNLDALLQWRGRAEITAFVRGMIRGRRITTVVDVLEHAGYEPGPFGRLEGRELAEIVDACIERIPNDNHRLAFRLRFVDGLEPREMAPRLGATAEMVRVWIARAGALVRSCIERKLGSGDQP